MLAHLYTVLLPLTDRGRKTSRPRFMQTVYLRGPQRVRPKKPRREITQLKTACFSNFIHCKENRFDTMPFMRDNTKKQHDNKTADDMSENMESQQTCLFEMTFPDEKGFWKKSRITALLNKQYRGENGAVTIQESQNTKKYDLEIKSMEGLTPVLVWRWTGQYGQPLGYRKIQRSQEPWGPWRWLVKLCILLTWKGEDTENT